MIRAVLDTNVLASGFASATRPPSAPGQVLVLWRIGRFELVTSEAIITELERVLELPYFAKRLSVARRSADIALLRSHATVVEITRAVHGIATHPEDDAILATAASARAAYLVTGDAQLCALGSFEDTLIVTPRQFLDKVTEA